MEEGRLSSGPGDVASAWSHDDPSESEESLDSCPSPSGPSHLWVYGFSLPLIQTYWDKGAGLEVEQRQR